MSDYWTIPSNRTLKLSPSTLRRSLSLSNDPNQPDLSTSAAISGRSSSNAWAYDLSQALPTVSISPPIESIDPIPAGNLQESEGEDRIGKNQGHLKTKSRMVNIKPFHGLRDGRELPDEYLEDIDFAYGTDHADLADRKNSTTAEEYKNNTCRILFRQNLRGIAADWYADLPAEDKTGWTMLRERFRTEFKVEKNAGADTFILNQRLATLAQMENEAIADYLR